MLQDFEKSRKLQIWPQFSKMCRKYHQKFINFTILVDELEVRAIGKGGGTKYSRAAFCTSSESRARAEEAQHRKHERNFSKARSRLYRNQSLQVNMRLTACFKLYKICTLSHRSKRNILENLSFKNQQCS